VSSPQTVARGMQSILKMAHKKGDFNKKGINSVIHWELSNIKEVKRDSLQNDRDTFSRECIKNSPSGEYTNLFNDEYFRNLQ
jgi:hypothetical protein